MGEAVVRVRMLGVFSLEYGDVLIVDRDTRSYKVWNLLAYLLYNRGRWIPRSDLLRLVGGQDRNNDPSSALRMTRMRARRVLEPLTAAVGIEPIVSSGSNYAWNPELPTEVDIERFEALCRAGAKAESGEEALDCYVEALRLYGGEFLGHLSDSSWAETAGAYYHNLYLDAASAAMPMLDAAGRSAEAVAVCRAALAMTPYHEPLCRQLMRSLTAVGDYAGADRAYKELREYLLSELGVLPDPETEAVYGTVVQRMGGRFVSPEALCELMREQLKPQGALICDFAMFKLFYQAEARSADRRGDAIHIGLLSLVGKDGRELTDYELDRAMGQLRARIQSTLRIGDVASRCSASQYVILLIQANYENSAMVCRRVAAAFQREYPRSPARVTETVTPLRPLFEPNAPDERW